MYVIIMRDAGPWSHRVNRQNMAKCFTISCVRCFSKRYKEALLGAEKRDVVARILLVQETETHLPLTQAQRGMCWLL